MAEDKNDPNDPRDAAFIEEEQEKFDLIPQVPLDGSEASSTTTGSSGGVEPEHIDPGVKKEQFEGPEFATSSLDSNDNTGVENATPPMNLNNNAAIENGTPPMNLNNNAAIENGTPPMNSDNARIGNGIPPMNLDSDVGVEDITSVNFNSANITDITDIEAPDQTIDPPLDIVKP